MAQEIASAYVTLLPSARGIGKGIEQELGGSVDGAARKGESSMRAMFGRVAGLAAVAGGVIAGAFGLSKIFGGGMARLMGIEEAQAKLRGLGNDAASVEVIMANALASVKGTSFGMAEAATTAAGAVAAGIKPGQDLERVLKSVSNSAAAAGVGMDEMGSIYNKVASLGKAQNDVLQQVADKGIPIYQALADQLGVTTDEVFKMASAGKISFAEFEEAMTTASGTVAEEMGTTLKGSIANFNASLSRIGANFLSGIFPYLAPAIQNLTERLGGVEDAAKVIGARMGEWLQLTLDKIGALRDRLEGLKGIFTGAGGGFEGIVALLSAAVENASEWLASGGAAQLVEGFLSARGALLGAAVAVFGALAEALPTVLPEVVRTITDVVIPGIVSALETMLPEVAGIIEELLPALADAAAGLATGLAGALSVALPQVITALADILPGILDTILGLLPTLIDAALTLFLGLVDGLVLALPPLIAAVTAAIPQIVDALVVALPQLVDGAVTLFLGLIDGLTQALPEIIRAVAEIIPPLVDALIVLAPQLVDAAMELFMGINEGLIQAMPEIIAALTEVIPQLWESLEARKPELIEAGIGMIGALIAGIVNSRLRLAQEIASLVAGAILGPLEESKPGITAKGREWIEGLNLSVQNAWPALQSFFAGMGERVKAAIGATNTLLLAKGLEIINGLRDGVLQRWTDLKTWLSGMKGRVLGAIPNPGTWLKSAGRSIIQGLIDGVKGMTGAATDAVSGVLSAIRSYLPFSPAKVGPFSGKGWTLYSGKAITLALAEGMRSERDQLLRSADSLLSPLQASLGGVNVDMAALSPAAAPAGPSLTQINHGVDAAELAQRNADQWRHWTTANAVGRR